MLGKLMKYEFRAIGRILPLLYAAWIFFSVLLSIDIVFLETGTPLGDILGMGFGSMYVILSFATVIVTFVIVIERFRRSLLCDEGYYMLTLPVKMETHITAKLLSSVIWGLFTGIVGIITFVIIATITSNFTIFDHLADAIDRIIALPTEDFVALIFSIIEVAVLMILAVARTAIKIFAALALGKISKKHPNLMAVAFYIGFGFIESTAWAVFFTTGRVIGINELFDGAFQNFSGTNIFLLFLIIVNVAVFAIYFIITDMVMKRKLDI